jgi:hypothetical protein
MLIDDLKPFLKEGVKPEDVNPIIDKGRFELIKSKDDAIKLLDTHDIFKTARDAVVSTGIESFRKNHYQIDLDNAVKTKMTELYPAETPEQKRIAALEKENAEGKKLQAEKDAMLDRERTLNKINIMADSELKLPAEIKPIIPFFLGADENASIENIKAVADVVNKIVTNAQKSIIEKYGNRVPGDGGETTDPKTLQEQIDEANKRGDTVLAMKLLGKMEKINLRQ